MSRDSISTKFAGRGALVTAGASGIGLTIAETLYEQGASIAVCDLPGPSLEALRASRSDWLVYAADVSNELEISGLYDEIDNRMPEFRILVNNAGIAGPTARVEDVTVAEWHRTLEVNLFGMFLCTRSAVPRLRAAGGGAIINLSSSAGRFGFPLRSPYAASKWGVVGFTKSMAIELGPDQITANAVLPGLVAGDRLEAVIAARALQAGRTVEAQRELMFERVAMRSSVAPGEIATTIAFLAGHDARHITGEAISVDAGLLSLT